jgi:hypothetical protein
MANKPGKGPGTYEPVLSASPTEVEIRRKEWMAALEDVSDRAIEFEDKLLASEWCEEDVRRVFDAFKREEARMDVATIKLAEAVTDADRGARLPRVRRSLSPEESERRIRLIKAGLNPDRVTEARRVLLEEVRPKPSQAPGPSKAPQPSKADKNFAVLVEVVEQICKSKQIVPHATKPCADRIKKAVDAILRAKRMGPAGIGRLKRALGEVRAQK